MMLQSNKYSLRENKVMQESSIKSFFSPWILFQELAGPGAPEQWSSFILRLKYYLYIGVNIDNQSLS